MAYVACGYVDLDTRCNNTHARHVYTGVYTRSTSPKWRAGTLISETRPNLRVQKDGIDGRKLVSSDVSLPLRGQAVLMLVTLHERQKVCMCVCMWA